MDAGLSAAALGAAFGAGIISVLSPCVMPLMPAYLSLISGISVEELRAETHAPGIARGRVLKGCSAFVAGFSFVFVLLGAGASALGGALRGLSLEVFGVSVAPVQLAGLVIVLMGMHLAGLLPLPILYRDARLRAATPRSWFGAALVGAAFAFGWSPCIGPVLGGILTLAGAHETAAEGMTLLAVYSAGLGVPFFLAGWSIEWFFQSFARVKRHFRAIERVSGALLVALGLLVMSNRLSDLNGYFSFLNTFALALEEWLL